MPKTAGDDEIAQALAKQESNVKLPPQHTSQVMQRISLIKLIRELLNLQIGTPAKVVKSLERKDK